MKKVKPKITLKFLTDNDPHVAKVNDALDRKRSLQVDKTLPILLKSFMALDISIPTGSQGKKDLLKLGKIMVETQLKREQAALIKMDQQKKLNMLNAMYYRAKAYLYNKYPDFLYQHKNADIREATLNAILFDLVDRSEICGAIVDVADTVLEILKDRYFTLCKINDICLATLPEKIKRDV